MNSTNEGNARTNLPSTSQNSDNNANPNMTTDESKGAIPKNKPKITPKKSNNNSDDTGSFSGEILKRNGYSKRSPNNYLNNTYAESDSDSERSSAGKELHRPVVDLKRTSFNIPLEDGFLNMSFVPLSHSSSSFVDLNKKDVTKYREQPEDDSSSDDNELLSVSDDGCIYTYKGDHAADLPSSFFNLEIPPLEEVPADPREENSSPEMDFLEMDFDPGPSGDADSDSISNTEIENAACLPLDVPPEEVIKEPKPSSSKDLNIDPLPNNENFHRYLNLSKIHPEPVKTPIIPKNEIKMPWSCSLYERTRSAKLLRTIKRHQSSKGQLLSPNENVSNGDITSSSLNALHNIYEKHLTNESNSNVEKVMIWSDQEACLKQKTQVGPSACGATAVLNVLSALRFPVPTIEHVQECVNTRLRANSSPLGEYLISRSNAGCAHRDIITALYKVSDKKIYSRFFAMYPERVVNLERWLGYWIKNGAVPVATLNLQKCERPIPDSWHHQMIFGVGPKGVYMTNPLECVDPSQLWPQLSSESVLLVRTEDVMSRWNPSTSWRQLLNIHDVRWKELNVVGQVARVVRERRRDPRSDHVITSHIKIPANYTAGITLAIDVSAPAFTLLRQCPELPLLYPEDAASAF